MIRPVLIHLSAWAPGCHDLPCGDERRWRTLFNVAAIEVLERVLKRLSTTADAVKLTRTGETTDVMAPNPFGKHDDAFPYSGTDDDGDAMVPMATFCFGVSYEEATTALNSLLKQRKKKT